MQITKTLIFDFDGTMVDSMPMWKRRVIELLDRHGAKYPENVIEIITPLGYEGMAKYFIECGVKGTVEEVLDTVYSFALDEYLNHIPAKQTVAEALGILKEKGCSLNVLTAAQHAMLDGCLKRLGIYDVFDNIWSSDDFGLKKSNPEIYLQAAQKLEREVSECTFFDDNITALRTAQSAGMKVVGVYDATSEVFIDEIKVFADGYIYHFSEIVENGEF